MEACGDRFVHYLAEQNIPVAMSTEVIRETAKVDPEIKQIRESIINNQSYKLPQDYKLVGDELSITKDIVLRGNRIVLPAKLRPRAIALAHEDHAGITRCKQRIRSKLWSPKMDKNIEDHIKTCHPCQVIEKPERPEPVCPTKRPDACCTHFVIDVCGPFPTGEFVVVLTDYYSRWPEVKILKTVTSENILQWLDSVFAAHGYPEEIKSDNASYFTSQEFWETLKTWGVNLRTVTEYWPQANGQVERFNQVLLNHVLTSRAGN
ncbi:Transposon Tf2-6 poly [Paramuricea clavata]|uniref:Transposon Tf2-6 poly n=1 Tax=Paramuricea clavata TaxID=317549 RepID=A0A6S7J359_PARCT|nr:Transposon Tf2-6 poly [Paramuricea clavata]